jgi:hypothetical protein
MICLAGIYPGVSNVMAAHMISIARREYNPDWSYTRVLGAEGGSSKAGSTVERVVASGDAESQAEAVPLRSGVATMEPNEGTLFPTLQAAR